jgi:hypothetical protein
MHNKLHFCMIIPQYPIWETRTKALKRYIHTAWSFNIGLTLHPCMDFPTMVLTD